MTADILVFPGKAPSKPAKASLTRVWAEQHAFLIEAAMDLLRYDNRELRTRC